MPSCTDGTPSAGNTGDKDLCGGHAASRSEVATLLLAKPVYNY